MRMTSMTMEGVCGGSLREESARIKSHHRMIITMRRPNITVRRRARVLLRKACDGVTSATAAATALALAEPSVVPSMATALRRLLASRYSRPSVSSRWTCFNILSTPSPPSPPSSLPNAIHSVLLVIHDLVVRVPFFYRYIANGRFLRALWRLQPSDHHLYHYHHHNQHCFQYHSVGQGVHCSSSSSSSGRGGEFECEDDRGYGISCDCVGEEVVLSPKLLVAAWARDLACLACTDVMLSRTATIQQVDPAAVFWVEAYKRLARRFPFPQPPSRPFVCPIHFPISSYPTLPPSPPPSPPPQPEQQPSSFSQHLNPFPSAACSVTCSPPPSAILSNSINSSSYPHSLTSRRFHDHSLSASPLQPTPSSSLSSSASSSSDYSSSSHSSFTASAVASTIGSTYRRPRHASLRNTAKFLAVLRRHNNVFGISDPYYIAPPTSATAGWSSHESHLTDGLPRARSRSTMTVTGGGGGGGGGGGSVSVAAVARENARRRISETRSASASATSSCAPSSSVFADSVATPLLSPHLAIEEDAYGCAVLGSFTGEVELKDDVAQPVTPCTFACLPVDGEGKKESSSSSRSPPPLLPFVDAKAESHGTENWVSDSDYDHSDYAFECDYSKLKYVSRMNVDDVCNARNDDVASDRHQDECVLFAGAYFPDVDVVSDSVIKTHFTVSTDGYVKETRVVSLPLLCRATRPIALTNSENFHPFSLHTMDKSVPSYSPWTTTDTHFRR